MRYSVPDPLPAALSLRRIAQPGKTLTFDRTTYNRLLRLYIRYRAG